jgi:hypothetical protein
MQHEMLAELAFHGVDQLLILRGAQRGNHQRLCLATGEQRRAMGARQHAHFRQNRAHGLGIPAVDPQTGVQNIVAHDIGFQLLEEPFRLLRVQPFLG